MNPPKKSLLEQMQIREQEISRRKKLLSFTPRDAELLVACRPFVQEELERLVDTFYDRQTAVGESAPIIEDIDTLTRLRVAMVRYTGDLFSGAYGAAYINNRLRIGLVHKRIGVGPAYYLPAMFLLKGLLMDVLARHLGGHPDREKTVLALDKLFHFDMEFVFDTYIGSLLAEIQSSKDKVVQHALKLEEKVAERTRELEELSGRDPLTELHNRRFFAESLIAEIKRGKRTAKPVSLLYLDLDGFKKINDREGHLAGDEVLRIVAQTIASLCRSCDVSCRYGGDEFCILLPATYALGAKVFAKRLLVEFADRCEMLTVSIGVAQAGPDVWPSPNELIDAADRAMYSAKSCGGGKVVIGATRVSDRESILPL